jgi:hypothetical protein
MNKSFDDDARFDRLVDGELSAEEYRALVASLDDEPSGWRRCALAFLESQALAGEMAGVRRSMTLGDDGNNPTASVPPATAHAQQQRGPGALRLTTLLAMAASFVVAFGLGIAAPLWFGAPNGPIITENPGSAPDTAVAVNTGAPADSANQLRHASFKPIGNLQFLVDGPGGSTTPVGDVPYYDLPGSMEQWLANERPALSPEVLQTLQDRGHRVERQVEYMPVLLEDGRQVIVPIERYQIRPARERPY